MPDLALPPLLPAAGTTPNDTEDLCLITYEDMNAMPARDLIVAADGLRYTREGLRGWLLASDVSPVDPLCSLLPDVPRLWPREPVPSLRGAARDPRFKPTVRQTCAAFGVIAGCLLATSGVILLVIGHISSWSAMRQVARDPLCYQGVHENLHEKLAYGQRVRASGMQSCAGAACLMALCIAFGNLPTPDEPQRRVLTRREQGQMLARMTSAQRAAWREQVAADARLCA